MDAFDQIESPKGDVFDQIHATAKASGKASAELYPTFSKVPGFEAVRPAFDFANGVGTAFADHVVGVYDLLRKIPGASKVLPDSATFHKSIAEQAPDTGSAKLGSTVEGIGEFLIPAGKVASLTKGASLLTRAAAQAAVGGGVSAVQTGGDPAATATGAVMGAGGELAGAATSGIAKMFGPKSPTLANFAESFGNATPTQKARISRSLDVLTRDGIIPPGSVHETQDIIKQRLEDIGKDYAALDPAIKAREVDPADVIDHLKDLRKQYTRRGIVTDPAAARAIDAEIQKVQQISAANPTGKVNVDDVVHLKQGANGKTSFNSPDADKSLWRGIGDAYRSAADTIAPETTPLNRDYQKYKDLEQIVDQNIARGKGTTPSGLTALANKVTQHAVGAAAGAKVGGAVAGPVGAAAGTVAGGIIGPKLGKAAAQMLQNAVDSGAFKALSPAKQVALRSMSAIGDNAGVLRLLGTSALEESAVGQ